MVTQTGVIRMTRGLVRVADLEVKSEVDNERALAGAAEGNMLADWALIGPVFSGHAFSDHYRMGS